MIKDVLKAMRKVKKKKKNFKNVKGRRKMVPEHCVALQNKESPENTNYIEGNY